MVLENAAPASSSSNALPHSFQTGQETSTSDSSCRESSICSILSAYSPPYLEQSAMTSPTAIDVLVTQLTTIEIPSSASRRYQRRYVTVNLAPTASPSVTPTSTLPPISETPKSSVPTETFVGVTVALVIVILLVLAGAIFLLLRVRRLRQQSLRSPHRPGPRSNPTSRSDTALSGHRLEKFSTPPPRIHQAPPISPASPPRTYTPTRNRSDTASPLGPYSKSGASQRDKTASPTNPTRTRIPTSKFTAPPITVTPARQTASPSNSQPRRPNAAFISGLGSRSEVQHHLANLQMLSDTTDMSTDTVDGPNGPRQLLNPATAARHAKAAAQGKNLALLSSDASEMDDPIAQIYQERINNFGPSGDRRGQGARTWENQGSGVTLPRPLNTKQRSGSDGPGVVERARPVARDRFDRA